MTLYRTLLRPLLFSLPPEKSHRLAEFALKQRFLWRALSPLYHVSDPRLHTSLAGIPIPNPVGLAAGFDKNCEYLPSILNLGFGYVTGGTVTPGPRPGNPRPRLLRLKAQQALINSLGFPGKGSDAARRTLEKKPAHPLILSIAGLSVDDFVECCRRLEAFADALELNVSSPNTAGLRVFHQPQEFRRLLDSVNAVRRKPLLIKLPPFADDKSRYEIISLVQIAKASGVNGLTVANTRPVKEPRLAVGAGGLSGKPLLPDTLAMVVEVRKEVGPAMTINACGGIFTAGDAIQALRIGANTVQLYTGLIYHGPGVARAINKGILQYLDEHRLPDVKAISGS
ncbi:MAG: quinone-dependent dihydroorotate dehydrogenase [SAR202 cluster bacterium]|nr:quinone-dependent dihydroorotate dehydrogenase [SAR202 cluster bacterium]